MSCSCARGHSVNSTQGEADHESTLNLRLLAQAEPEEAPSTRPTGSRPPQSAKDELGDPWVWQCFPVGVGNRVSIWSCLHW